jgi:competence protein ComEA
MDKYPFYFFAIALVIIMSFTGYRIIEKRAIGKEDGILSVGEMNKIVKDSAQKIVAGIKIDINGATLDELEALPGISRNVAYNLIEYRGRHGNFKGFNELLLVKGIKEKKLKEILPFIEL